MVVKEASDRWRDYAKLKPVGKEGLRMEATAGDQERGASSFQVDRRHNPHGGKLLDAWILWKALGKAYAQQWADKG
ncbi:hypothetical protein RR48_09350 [Papilio machaon]|uniref:Uncharacterized protein n=1 Tax=Papilio machaon TaxID=76193 RepID=A0A194RBV7_PAPMA|nr:hypothetical protein RR48_09350 [Papilio machaon]